MIGKLSGTIDSISGRDVIVDVQGVGYVVACSARTLRFGHILNDIRSTCLVPL
ncbi:MAG: hypothetical protein EBV03_13265 [Proteobacteria bacterium]|nr:hypothetical protein [Pseudomonadota bacterium]